MYPNFSIILFFWRKCYQVGAYFGKHEHQIHLSGTTKGKCLIGTHWDTQMGLYKKQVPMEIFSLCLLIWYISKDNSSSNKICGTDIYFGNLSIWVTSNWSIHFCHWKISASFWGSWNCGRDSTHHAKDRYF